MRNKTVITILIVLILLSLSGGVFFSIKNKNNNTNKSISAIKDPNHPELETNKQEETITKADYAWEMKVINSNGAKVYTRNEFYEESVVETLILGTKVKALGDLIISNDSESTFNPDKLYIITDITEENKVKKYIKYTDLELIDNSVHYLDESSSYIYTTEKQNIKSGPALFFENIGTIPENILLEVLYSKNNLGDTWYYVRYKGITGWVLNTSLTTEQTSYKDLGFIESKNILVTIKEESIKVYKDLKMYSYINDINELLVIPNKSKITYDLIAELPEGGFKLRVNYNGVTGWINGVIGCADTYLYDTNFLVVDSINKDGIKLCK